MNNFILDSDGNPVEEADVTKWADWFKSANRVIRKDCVGKALVSTVFLGVDHSFGLGGPPLLYETMIFGVPGMESYLERYATRDEALAGHDVALAKLA